MRQVQSGALCASSSCGAVLTLGALTVAWMPTPASAAEPIQNIEEIVVTAQKRGEERLVDVPIAISAFGGKYLESTGAKSITDFVQASPGVSVFKVGEASSTLQIRGISSLFGDAVVGYYLDDLPFSLVNLQFVPDISPYDLERVEVLRGPQGTLYGASSEGGTVRILTRNADPDAFEAKGDFWGAHTEGAGDNFSAQGAVNVPIVPGRAAVRLSGGYREMSGFIDNPVTGEEDINDSKLTHFRAKATVLATDRLTLRASAWLSRADEDAPPYANDDLQRPVAFAELIATDYDLYNVAMEYRFPSVTLYSTTSYIDYDLNVTDAAFGVPAVGQIKYEAVNEELRLASTGEGPFSWTAGLFYLDADHDQVTDIMIPTGPGAFNALRVADSLKTSKQWAVFGEGHYAFLDNRLRATLGLRYFEDEREQTARLPSVIDALALFGVPADRRETFDDVSPRFNLSYQLSDAAMVYVNIAKGFRSGFHQFDTAFLVPGLSVPLAADPETVRSYEVGAKWSMADGALVAEAAVYRNDWSDLQQITSQVVDVGGTPVLAGYVQNAGSARAYGVDVNIAYRPVQSVTLQLGGNFNNSEYTDDVPGLSGISDGDRITYVPELTLSGSVDYRRPIAEGFSGVLSTSAQYSSSRNDYLPGMVFRSDAMTLWNASAGIEADSWGVFLTAENLLNESGKVIDSAVNPFDPRPRPRTYGVLARVKF